MSTIVREVELSAEQEAEAQRIAADLAGPFNQELLRMARLMASKANEDLLGQTEFEIRDIVHDLGAKVIKTAADERQKKGAM